MKTLKKMRFTALWSCFLCMSSLDMPTYNANYFTVIGFAEKDMVYDASNFYAKQLKIENVNFRIISSNDLPEKIEGCVIFEENEYLSKPNALIKIRKNLKRNNLLKVLAHEMTHVKQYAKKELIYHHTNHYEWKGKCFEDIQKIHYYQRAWEKEAIQIESDLYHKFLMKNCQTTKGKSLGH